MNFNKEQLEAINLPLNQSAFISAGAGSGKTRVLTHRIAHLMTNGIDGENILAVTFTNKAANEMKERIGKTLDAAEFVGKRNFTLGTFHAICLGFLRENHKKADLPQNFEVIDPDDQRRIVKSIVKFLNLPENASHELHKMYDEQKVNFYVQQINSLKDGLIPREKLRNTEYLFDLYQENLQNTGKVDFGELMFRTIKLFTEYPEVLNYYVNRFSHILVDEYQDTNKQQFEWLMMLLTRKMGKFNTIFAVGDDDQSIYGFRGSKSENITDLAMKLKDLKIIKLEQNYRSTSPILQAANNVIVNNLKRTPKSLWTDKTNGNKIICRSFENDADEARYVVTEIQNLLKQNKDSEITILYRTNAQSRMFETEMRKKNVPYKMYGGLGFYDRAEVKDVLSFILFLADHNDDRSLARIINYPNRGIGDVTVWKIEYIAQTQKISLFEALKDDSFKENKPVQDFLTLVDEMTEEFTQLQPASVAQYLVNRLDLKKYYIQNTKFEEEYDTKMENIMELGRAIGEYFTTFSEEEKSYTHFKTEVNLGMNDAAKEKEQTNVKMMTIHAAKGLEFEVVFLVNCNEDVLPHERAIKNNDIDEERRLMYVAITRAKEQLYVTYSDGIDGEPSRFIKEMKGKKKA